MQSYYLLPASVAGARRHARSLSSSSLLLGALLLAAPALHAQTVVFDGSEPTMTPRFFRAGTPGQACGTFGAGSFQYTTVPFVTDGSGTLAATVNEGTCGTNTFVTFHVGSFNPANICENHHWDFGSSVSFSESFAVPANTPMVMVFSGVNNAPGVACSMSYTLTGGGSSVPLGTVLTRAGSSDPQVVAEELRIPPTRTFANPVGAFNLSSTLEYAFSDQEVRYARLECPGVTFDSGAVTLTGPAGSVVGAINGMGSSAITFSITAGATPLVASNTFTVDGTRTLTGKDPVSCRYGLYDTPSQAQAGGADGRIVTTSGQYLSFGPSYQLAVDAQGRATADVEAELAFGEFVLEASAIDYDLAQLGRISYGATDEVTGDDQPITLDGEAVTLPELLAATTTLRVAGDFSVADAVYLSTAADCSVVSLGSSSLTDSEAVVTVGNTSRLDHYVCYQTDGAAIPESVYSVALTAVSATPALYATANRGPLSLGEVLRNGTQLQAPFAQVPGGWQSRLVLTNTGGIARAYSLTVQGEAGNVIETGDLSGVIPANGTLVIEDLNTVLTGFSAAPRATINVNAAGPNHQIQGLYQIVDPAKGTISNHVLVRPGSN
jgi:hypothetical protein